LEWCQVQSKCPHQAAQDILAPSVVPQRDRHQLGKPQSIISLASNQQAAARTDLRIPKFHPDAAVAIDPICPLQARAFRVIHETRPWQPATE